MDIKKTLCGLVAVTAIGLVGCKKADKDPFVYGTVIKEAGTIVDRQLVIEKSEGALFGNDSVRFGEPTYAIQFKADDGKVYTFAIDVTKGNERHLEALNLAIEEGTRVRIPKIRFTEIYGMYGTVGDIWWHQLEVLEE